MSNDAPDRVPVPAPPAETTVAVLRSDVQNVADILEQYVDCPEVWDQTIARLRAALRAEPSPAPPAVPPRPFGELCPGDCVGNYCNPENGKRYLCQHQIAAERAAPSPATSETKEKDMDTRRDTLPGSARQPAASTDMKGSEAMKPVTPGSWHEQAGGIVGRWFAEDMQNRALDRAGLDRLTEAITDALDSVWEAAVAEPEQYREAAPRSPAREPIQDIIASLRTREQERLAKAYGLPYDLKGIARSNSYLVALVDVEAALASPSSSTAVRANELAAREPESILTKGRWEVDINVHGDRIGLRYLGPLPYEPKE